MVVLLKLIVSSCFGCRMFISDCVVLIFSWVFIGGVLSVGSIWVILRLKCCWSLFFSVR